MRLLPESLPGRSAIGPALGAAPDARWRSGARCLVESFADAVGIRADLGRGEPTGRCRWLMSVLERAATGAEESASLVWDRRLLDECEGAARGGQPFVLVLLVLDGASALTSETLDLVGDSLRSGVRQADVVARVGPAAFAIMLFDANPEHAPNIGERMVQHVRDDAGSLVRELKRLPMRFGAAALGSLGRVDALIAAVQQDLGSHDESNGARCAA